MMRLVWSPELKAPRAFISMSKAYEVVRPLLDLVGTPSVLESHGVQVVAAGPAGAHPLYRAHDPQYVEGVCSLKVLNGFGTCDAASLRHILAANGVMIKAVQEALDHPADVVCAPVSGFHHAHYAAAAGYCTFNGLLVALAAARAGRRVKNVLIIDGDAHCGDGTDDILCRTAVSGVTNLTHRPEGSNRLDRGIWEQQIRGLLTNRTWDLVLYQAGADAHIADPYGEGYLTDADWDSRDELIFSYCRARKFPLVFNFAGGYNGEKTVALHRRTMNVAKTLYRSSGMPSPQSQA